MVFRTLCKADPLLAFIRSTYGAVPLRVPDQRFAPLSIFSIQARRARYLGTLSDIAVGDGWVAPPSSASKLGEVSTISSSDIGWSAASEILGPFLSSALGIASVPVDASLSGARKTSSGVRVTIRSARKVTVNPFAIAHAIQPGTHQLPASLHTNDQDLYIIDTVFLARDLSLDLVGANASDAAAKFEADLIGNAEAQRILRVNSTLTISGNGKTPFAFTCLKVDSDAAGFITSVVVGTAQPRMNATPVSPLQDIPRDMLGEPDELISFDE